MSFNYFILSSFVSDKNHKSLDSISHNNFRSDLDRRRSRAHNRHHHHHHHHSCIVQFNLTWWNVFPIKPFQIKRKLCYLARPLRLSGADCRVAITSYCERLWEGVIASNAHFEMEWGGKLYCSVPSDNGHLISIIETIDSLLLSGHVLELHVRRISIWIIIWLFCLLIIICIILFYYKCMGSGICMQSIAIFHSFHLSLSLSVCIAWNPFITTNYKYL